jgi:hypothetical protein
MGNPTIILHSRVTCTLARPPPLVTVKPRNLHVPLVLLYFPFQLEGMKTEYVSYSYKYHTAAIRKFNTLYGMGFSSVNSLKL